MKQEPHFIINWKNVITEENNEIMIYGNVDKITGKIYYICTINDKRKFVLTIDENNKWCLDNVIPPMNNKEKNIFQIKETEFIEDIGKVISVYDILQDIEKCKIL